MTQGLVELRLVDFIARFPPTRWGEQLADYTGGEVVVLERDAQSRPVRQKDRMRLYTLVSRRLGWMGRFLPMVRPLDMTKTETLEYGPDRVQVAWRVYHSDNRTVIRDTGGLRLIAHGEHTMVRFHSIHELPRAFTAPLNRNPLRKMRDAIIQDSLRSYFVDTIEKYRRLASR
jgi:hypothetical protein